MYERMEQINKWAALAKADLDNYKRTLTNPYPEKWAPKLGDPTVQTRTFNRHKYVGLGPRIYAEVRAHNGIIYWGVYLADAVKRPRGGYEPLRIASGRSADIPTAMPVLKARITRIAMAHVRKQLDSAITRTIEAMRVAVAEHEGIAAATADLDLADARAVITWDRNLQDAAKARDEHADRLEELLALAES